MGLAVSRKSLIPAWLRAAVGRKWKAGKGLRAGARYRVYQNRSAKTGIKADLSAGYRAAARPTSPCGRKGVTSLLALWAGEARFPWLRPRTTLVATLPRRAVGVPPGALFLTFLSL